ncbi:MAG: hypothetical protein ACXVRS_15360 [Gaiellaceae bacterium]
MGMHASTAVLAFFGGYYAYYPRYRALYVICCRRASDSATDPEREVDRASACDQILDLTPIDGFREDLGDDIRYADPLELFRVPVVPPQRVFVIACGRIGNEVHTTRA